MSKYLLLFIALHKRSLLLLFLKEGFIFLFFAAKLRKLGEELFLLGGELGGCFDGDGEDKVSASSAARVDVGNALAAYGEGRTRLRSFGDIKPR